MTKRRKMIYGAVLLILIGALVLVVGKIIAIQRDYAVADEEYSGIQAQLKDAVAQDSPAIAANESLIKLLDSYSEQNADFLGIIYIPGTNIIYPVVQGSDNSYYLTHTYNRSYSSSGAIFVDSGADPTFNHPNTIIYGHNMHNGTMFENLNFFADPAFLDQHDEVYLITLSEVRLYHVFSAKYTTFKDPLYQTLFEDEGEVLSYFDRMAPGYGLTAEDTIITLSTCTYQYDSENRIVVQAALFQSTAYR